MKITTKVLNLPPYISTTWKEVSSLHTRIGSSTRPILVVVLRNGAPVEVPHLAEPVIREIFEAYTHYHELEKPSEKKPLEGPFHFSIPLKKGIPLDSMGVGMQHDPNQAQMPNLPPEILEKVTQIAKAFGLDDTSVLPTPEPHCNCVHCQIVRSLHGTPPTEVLEESIEEGDLKFRNWDIKQTGDKLYIVTNPLDQNEQYNVFLGTPLGCTCGLKNCEHICAVLNS